METSESRLRLQRSSFRTLESKLNPISFYFFCAFVFDCAWSGAGRWLMFGPISIRMLLLGFALLCSIPSIILHAKTIASNVFILLLLLLLGILIINAVRGVVSGNNKTILMDDIKGFSYYAMFPTLLVIINSKKRVRALFRVIVLGSSLLAILVTAIFIDYAALAMRIPIDLQILTDLRIIAVNPMGGTLIRVFTFSGIYLVAGIICSFYLCITSGRMRWVYPISTAFCLFALMVHFTRSLYFGFAVALVTVLILFPTLLNQYNRIWTFLLASLVAFSMIVVPVSIAGNTNYLSYAVEKTLITFQDNTFADSAHSDSSETPQASTIPITSSEISFTTITPASSEPSNLEIHESIRLTVASDILRHSTLDELREKISRSPIVGQGLGAAVESRESGATEYFYLDFMHKTGVIGLAVYLAPLFALLGNIVLNLIKRQQSELFGYKYLLLCCLAGFMGTSYFNPYMNAALGVTMFSMTMAVNSI